jgi:methionine sulfoxide reductase heme-binding subunit
MKDRLVQVDPGPHLFWITSRAAGIVALAAASVSVALGLWMSLKLRGPRRGDLRVLHETLSLSALVAIAVHGAALLGDGFLRPSVLDLTVPFVSGYKTVWTSMGIVSGWALALLGLSYYARARIGPARWRRLHRFTALAWLLGLAHSLGEGTDAATAWFLAMTGVVAIPPLALLLARFSLSSNGGDRPGRLALDGVPRANPAGRALPLPGGTAGAAGPDAARRGA